MAGQSDCLMAGELRLMLEAWQAANATATVIHLSTSNRIPQAGDSLESYSEPVGTWYATQPGVIYETSVNPDGSASLNYQSVAFNYSGSSAAETIYSYFVTTTVSSVTTLLHARNLPDGPQTMGSLGSQVIVEPGFRLAPVPQQ
jgi:hypothetical protein